MNKFNPADYEKKWSKKWVEEKLYATPEVGNTDKFYSLYSFPYPSGAGLHVGHAEGMVANDIAARYYRMKGRAVTLPMGWDSFGLPAENYAIKTGVHPHESTESAVKTFIQQINNLGISVDWDKEVGAHRSDYYKWTQWIFLQLYKKGLAYKKEAPVNWCPKDQTVLANEQVVNGKCERCDTEVVQKNMSQWFFKITDFADRLDKDLDTVDWPESTKLQQRNWIGKSEGTIVKFKVNSARASENSPESISKNQESEDKSPESVIEVFTTRVDTIFGATFLVLAPEHEFVTLSLAKGQITNADDVQRYIADTQKKTELDRQINKDKTGVILEGIFATNPFNGAKIPIFIADYVLMGYGTGAIMAVPAHDERDGAFAKKFQIETIEVIKPAIETQEMFTGYGTLINSGDFNGMTSEEATEKMQSWLEENNLGKKVTNYKLRDWLVSRQRYWGAPIPIVYDPEGNPHAVDEADLPLLLPTDVDFKPTGESPITTSKSFIEQAEAKYGKGWRYEVDTMDTFVDSSWYFFRFTDAKNEETFAGSEKMNAWLPVDLYMIGAEHTVLHLLYSRFFTKFFYDQGLINFHEPFYKMRHMGTILGPDGKKMSKRWGNVINPDDEVEKYSGDTVRMYEMFMGPLEEAKPWNDRAENGVFRFLGRVWNLQEKVQDDNASAGNYDNQEVEINKLIKKVSGDIETLSFNTSVAKFMEFVNFAEKENQISKEVWRRFLLVLAPFAPFITEELWKQAGYEYSIHMQQWPEYDESKLLSEKVKIAVQINGKVRDVIEIPINSSEDEAIAIAKTSDKVLKFLTNDPKKVIYVQNKILNIIV